MEAMKHFDTLLIVLHICHWNVGVDDEYWKFVIKKMITPGRPVLLIPAWFFHSKAKTYQLAIVTMLIETEMSCLCANSRSLHFDYAVVLFRGQETLTFTYQPPFLSRGLSLVSKNWINRNLYYNYLYYILE